MTPRHNTHTHEGVIGLLASHHFFFLFPEELEGTWPPTVLPRYHLFLTYMTSVKYNNVAEGLNPLRLSDPFTESPEIIRKR